MAEIKRISERRYRIRVSKGTGDLRHFINKTVRGTLAEAKQFARELESQLDRGRSPQSLQSLLKYSEQWRSRLDAKDNTKDFYERMIRLYAAPLHDKPLFKITSNHIQSIYDNLEVSPNTVRHLHSTLRAMFNYAVKKRHLPENPVLFTDPPKRSKPEMSYFNESEAMRFVAACQNAPRGLIFELALETGMRPGEYLALKRSDLAYGSASVNRTVSRNGAKFTPPKTNASRRLVPLSQPLWEKVQAHLETHPFDLVFCTGLGTAYAQKNVTRDLQAIVKDAELPSISLYSLRHTCATLMLLGGINPKVVADRLGHTSVTTTLDKYSHVLPHIQEAATDKLSEILRGAHNLRIHSPIESDLVQ